MRLTVDQRLLMGFRLRLVLSSSESMHIGRVGQGRAEARRIASSAGYGLILPTRTVVLLRLRRSRNVRTGCFRIQRWCRWLLAFATPAHAGPEGVLRRPGQRVQDIAETVQGSVSGGQYHISPRSFLFFVTCGHMSVWPRLWPVTHGTG